MNGSSSIINLPGYDNALASAVLDRLLHYSHIIRITGNSYRIKDKIVESDSRTNKYNE